MDDSTVFTCQECKQPIYIDASLVDLSPTAYDVLQASLPKKEPSTSKQPSRRELVDHVPASKEMKDIWEKAQQSQQPEQSFILLQESVLRDMPPSTPTPSSSKHPKSTSPKSPKQTVKQVSLSHRIQSHAKLFSFLSANSEVDHPLCEECTHVLYTALTKKLEETKRERDGYIAFEREIRKEKERSKGKEEEDLKEVIEKLKREESKAMEELRGADAERIALEEELAALEEEERALEKEEEDFFTTYNSTLISNKQLNDTISSLHASLTHSSSLLSKLERTNVYADAFCIGVDGAFGTINGLRFGRSAGATGVLGTGASTTVEWAEVNAAWGLTVLCLSTIARKLDYEFDTYTLHPRASFSAITQYPPASGKVKGDTYELYASTDLHLGRLLHNRRFDSGMVFFLDALRLIIAHVKETDSSVEFPHAIVKDKIGDASIKLQFAQEDVWTRALRHVLLALKIVLRWMTNVP